MIKGLLFITLLSAPLALSATQQDPRGGGPRTDAAASDSDSSSGQWLKKDKPVVSKFRHSHNRDNRR